MKKILIGSIMALFILGLIIGGKLYVRVYGDNIRDEANHELLIPTGSNYEDVVTIISKQQLLKDVDDFAWVAEKMNYPKHVYPGRYLIETDLSNRDLVKLLRSGQQTPLDVMLTRYRIKTELAEFVSKQLEIDSAELVKLLNDNDFLSRYDLNRDNAMAIFLPDKYEFYWTTDAKEFIERMHKEFITYWSDNKNNKAEELGLEPLDVMTLASIVEEESYMKDERPAIAGVYLNRLRRKMRLQADPTVKFALQNFEMRRILTKHTKINSPYNTYIITGLPPGPICTPSKNSIESVLNAEDHDYLYFCAKDDFSGYHAFSSTYTQHINNARKFQRALNQKNIMR